MAESVSPEEKRKRELDDIRAVMLTLPGRRVLNRIIQECNVFGEIFSPNGSVTNKNLGRRDIGIFVYAELESACPDLFLKMRQEHVKEN